MNFVKGNKRNANQNQWIDFLLYMLRQVGSACDTIPMLKNLGPDRLKGLS